MRRQYPFHLIEPKWQRFWDEQGTFRAWNPGDCIPEDHPFAKRHGVHGKVSARQLPEKYYILDMFPYPSGAGLHVGHPEGYTATDILARYRRALGFNVLHPIGWDAFGLPAEQYAIRTGQHPRQTTEANITVFKRQIKALGFSYDWSREINTTDPAYFRWTQWIFLKLYNSWFNPASQRAESLQTLPDPTEAELPAALDRQQALRIYRDNKRLAYVAEAPVWWCEELGTVLANEEVIEGKSEVGGFPVVRKPMRQWMLRITAYAERLLEGLEHIQWSHSLKEMQRNWIGRSEGAEVRFGVAGSEAVVTVFTTRPDTLFGATYMVLSPEHYLVDSITAADQRDLVASYKAQVAKRSDLERTEAKEKTGVFTGAYAINPVNNEPIPIWIADYVLATYGTGAIMAVPAHDTRDLEFARKFNLAVRVVVEPPPGQEAVGFVGEGRSVNSDFISGLATAAAKKKITAWLEERARGRPSVNYKLRDWLFSRQRYWGEPFPIVWEREAKGGLYHEGLPQAELPVLPPELTDFKPTASGEPPLARATKWVNRPDGSMRETNTMPQWAGSCWYYLRFLDPHNARAFCATEPQNYWMGAANGLEPAPTVGVDLYVGGIEHAVLHLLYSRFWHKVLFDLGYASAPEPFFKLVNQGLILGEDGQKMSKSCGNVVNPDEILLEYGADAFRLYEMFMGPLEMVKPWNTKGVEGVYRFLGRVWRLFIEEQSEAEFEQNQTAQGQQNPSALDRIQLSAAIQGAAPAPAQLKTLHACIKKVSEDLEGLRFNTAISALMIFVNDAVGWETKPASVLREFLILLHPFAPHLAEELFAKLTALPGMEPKPRFAGLSYEPWPTWDPAVLAENSLEIPVQINGKLRERIVVSAEATPAQVEAAALASEKIKQWLGAQTVKKVIVVPKRLVNIVI